MRENLIRQISRVKEMIHLSVGIMNRGYIDFPSPRNNRTDINSSEDM